MVYQRISPIPDNADSLKSEELAALAEIWREKHAELGETESYQEFVDRLHREWAIETGLIERLYSWDRGVTETLIANGILASTIERNAGMGRDDAEDTKTIIGDQLNVVNGLFSFVKDEQPLTEHYIKGLQAQFTRNQKFAEALTASGDKIKIPLEKGKYKTQPNSPRKPDGDTHDYAPPELVIDEMEQLVRCYAETESELAPEVMAAWLHHRFTQIHPFQDGNGRVARALASLVFMKAGLFPLVIRDADRKAYYDALESADGGDLVPLVDLFVARQKNSVLKAIDCEQEVRGSDHLDEILASSFEKLGTLKASEGIREELYAKAKKLTRITQDRLLDLESGITPKLQELELHKVDYKVELLYPDGISSDPRTFTLEIEGIAKELKYFANLARYSDWIGIRISTKETFYFIVSVHGYGQNDDGLLAISATVLIPDMGREGKTWKPHSSCLEPFIVNDKELIESIEKRFQPWLQTSITMGMAEWNRTLDT